MTNQSPPATRDDLLDLERRSDGKLQGLEVRMDDKLTGLEQRFDTKLDARFAEFEIRMDSKLAGRSAGRSEERGEGEMTDPALARVIAAWPNLPDAICAAMLALIQSQSLALTNPHLE